MRKRKSSQRYSIAKLKSVKQIKVEYFKQNKVVDNLVALSLLPDFHRNGGVIVKERSDPASTYKYFLNTSNVTAS